MKIQDIQTGDVVFVTGSDWFSRLIRIYTNSTFSHVAIVYMLGDDNYVRVAEATWHGFKISNYHINYVNSSCHVARVKKALTAPQRDSIRSEIVKNLGLPYDFLSLVKIVVKWPSRSSSVDKMICSEAVDRVYEQAIQVSLVEKQPDLITPYDLSTSPKLTFLD